jgi:hypothetical protein
MDKILVFFFYNFYWKKYFCSFSSPGPLFSKILIGLFFHKVNKNFFLIFVTWQTFQKKFCWLFLSESQQNFFFDFCHLAKLKKNLLIKFTDNFQKSRIFFVPVFSSVNISNFVSKIFLPQKPMNFRVNFCM